MIDPGRQDVEGLLRSLTPQVLGVLVRRFGDFSTCEDALQEALLAAALHWAREGVPDNARGWLVQTAARRFTDLARSEQARRRREDLVAREPPPGEAPAQDDTMTLLFLCCHAVLSPASQVALTLRAVGGLATGEIAHAYLVPEATMAQRISRAKQQLQASGARFRMPPRDGSEWPSRVRSVLRVLYLIFNEGYTATRGSRLQRVELSTEAIRLTRELHRGLPDEGEASALLALMLLTDARRSARTGRDGQLVPLAEQDRTRWDRRLIAEGTALLDRTMSSGRPGEYRVQAAIAALHDRARRPEDTDWPQILALYEILEPLGANPVVTLNRAVARAMVEGPQAGLATLAMLDGDARLARQHRVHAVRAHLLEMAGEKEAALAEYREAAALTTSLPERRYLLERAARLRR
ncbi:MAG: RNA polymerase sigma factor [Candidatus Dormibacteraeota bacterium]|nr:RNA polymerase sigma factor [Candidatus Dormibacteraeota bacterium]